jgi:8-oxo-dGTP pyrophosphatase MutT (NUDIX family)
MRSKISINNFAARLKAEILKGLPGTEVQWQMATLNRVSSLFPGDDARVAAVLILLYPENGSINTVFMQRPEYDGVHGGQISFPGGKKEAEDESTIQTAIREAWEETGTDPEQVSVIGSLTPLFIPVSNMLVTPVVGWTEVKPVFKHKPDEVLFLIDAELRSFMDESIIRIKPFEVRGEMLEIKYFDYNGNTIWGATAMILNELLTILKRGDFFRQE